MPSQIELKNISKQYLLDDAKIMAVDGVSLNIEKADFVSIVGHSGSGKTTLMSIIGGILRPTSGEVLFNGVDIYSFGDEALSEYRAESVGYIFQFASLLPVLTAKENLMLPTLFKTGAKSSDHGKRALEYLDMVGLADKANAYPSQLSGGQQRRVAIARSLMNDPQVILADEPTGDLDETTEAEVMGIFKKINREKNITFVLITHSSELAAQTQRVIRMTNGRVDNSKNNLP